MQAIAEVHVTHGDTQSTINCYNKNGKTGLLVQDVTVPPAEYVPELQAVHEEEALV